MPQIGDVLSQKYQLQRLLGSGGMGAVYEARHVEIGKRLAVKFLHPQLAEDSEVVARFKREAQAAAAIGHKNIIDITDIDRLDDGSVYLVMEYLSGCDLHATIRQAEGVLPADLVMYVAAQTLSALASAHDIGIIHRDLKPENIFLVETGQALPDVKLLDFGISKMTKVGQDEDRLTKTGVLMGTPFYMSPEQARGAKDVDGRSDIYAVGVIMYEALAGQVPFYADNTFALIFEILNTDLVPPRDLNPDLDKEIEDIVLRAMSRDLDERYGSAEDMLQDVLLLLETSTRDRISLPAKRPLMSQETLPPTSAETLAFTEGDDDSPEPEATMPPPTAAQGELPSEAPASAPPTETSLAWHSGIHESLEAAPPRSKRGWLIGLGLAAGVLIGAVLVFALNFSGESSEPPTQPAAATEPEPQAPQVEDMVLTLVGIPEGARIFLEEEPVEGPVIRAPQGDTPREVRVEVEGYLPWRQSAVFDADRVVTVEMERIGSGPDAGPEPGAGEAEGLSKRPRSKIRQRRDNPAAAFGTEFDD